MGCGTPIPFESSPLWPQSSNTLKSVSPVRRQFMISDLGQDGRRAATKNGIKNKKYTSPDSAELLFKPQFLPGKCRNILCRSVRGRIFKYPRSGLYLRIH
jgi:hypothetical protein